MRVVTFIVPATVAVACGCDGLEFLPSTIGHQKACAISNASAAAATTLRASIIYAAHGEAAVCISLTAVRDFYFRNAIIIAHDSLHLLLPSPAGIPYYFP